MINESNYETWLHEIPQIEVYTFQTFETSSGWWGSNDSKLFDENEVKAQSMVEILWIDDQWIDYETLVSWNSSNWDIYFQTFETSSG